MIQFRSWRKVNAAALADVTKKRKTRGTPMTAPLSLHRVMVSSDLDGEFARFAALVGGATAETYFLRALQYAALHDGVGGCVRVPRAMWAAMVLSRPWHSVGRATGERVYDALLESRICVAVEGGPTPPETPSLSRDTSPDTVPGQVPGQATPLSGDVTPSPTAASRAGTGASACAPVRAKPETTSLSRDTSRPALALALNHPPTPFEGEGSLRSPTATANGHGDHSPEAVLAARTWLRGLVADIPNSGTSASVAEALRNAVTAAGGAIDPNSHHDALVLSPHHVAIECDNTSPRQASLERLASSTATLRAFVLRSRTPDTPRPPDGIELLVAGELRPTPVSLCTPHRRPVPCGVCEIASQRVAPAPDRRADIQSIVQSIASRTSPAPRPPLHGRPVTDEDRAALRAALEAAVAAGDPSARPLLARLDAGLVRPAEVRLLVERFPVPTL